MECVGIANRIREVGCCSSKSDLDGIAPPSGWDFNLSRQSCSILLFVDHFYRLASSAMSTRGATKSERSVQIRAQDAVAGIGETERGLRSFFDKVAIGRRLRE